jgi:hypothetical protein
MQLWVMPRLSIFAHSCAAIECTPCSVAARACPSSFCCPQRALHDAPFARPLLEWGVRLYRIRPRIIRLDAGYWGLRLIAWIHAALGAVAVVPWNRHSRSANRSCLPPTWRHARSWANAAPSNVSLVASSSSFIDNVRASVAGLRSHGRSL